MHDDGDNNANEEEEGNDKYDNDNEAMNASGSAVRQAISGRAESKYQAHQKSATMFFAIYLALYSMCNLPRVENCVWINHFSTFEKGFCVAM